MENQCIIETEYSWIIQIPSYIKHKFDAYSTREGYVDSHDLMMAQENGVRPHYPREDWILSATQQTDRVSESLEQIICQFKEIMFMKGYDQKVKSADLHKGRTNHQSHVRFIMHDDIIVIEEVVTTETVSKNNSHINMELGFPILFDQGAFQNLGDTQFIIEPTLSNAFGETYFGFNVGFLFNN